MHKIILLLFILFFISACHKNSTNFNNKTLKNITQTDLKKLFDHPNITSNSKYILENCADKYLNLKTYQSIFEIKFYSFGMFSSPNNTSKGKVFIKKPLNGYMELISNSMNPENNGAVSINNADNYYEYIPNKNEYILTKSLATIFEGNKLSKQFSLIDALAYMNPIAALIDKFTLIRVVDKTEINKISCYIIEIIKKNSNTFLWIGEKDFIIYKIRFQSNTEFGTVYLDENHFQIKINKDIPDDLFKISPAKNAKKVNKYTLDSK